MKLFNKFLLDNTALLTHLHSHSAIVNFHSTLTAPCMLKVHVMVICGKPWKNSRLDVQCMNQRWFRVLPKHVDS